MKQLSNQRGFLLIEFLISFVIFTGLVLALAQYQWHILQWQQESQKRFLAVHEAQSVLERIRATHQPIEVETNGIRIEGSLMASSPLRKANLGTDWSMSTPRFRIVRVQASWRSVLGQQCSYELVSGCFI